MTTFSVNIHLKKTTVKVDFRQMDGTSCLSFGSTDDYNQVNLFITMDQLKGVITDLQRFVTPPDPTYPNGDHADLNTIDLDHDLGVRDLTDPFTRAEQMP